MNKKLETLSTIYKAQFTNEVLRNSCNDIAARRFFCTQNLIILDG